MSNEEIFAKKITSYLDSDKSALPPSIESRLALAREKAVFMRKKEETVLHNGGGLLSLGNWAKTPFFTTSSGVLAAGALVVAFMAYNFTSLFSLYPTPVELNQNTPGYQNIIHTIGSWNKYEKNMEEDLSSLDAYVLYQANDSDSDSE